jgi:arylsulfatase A-like enzyme
VSIDTLRADRLPDYGSTRITTPAISGLRRGGLLFRDVYSHAPLTLPAHASVFTGLLPFAHHVRDNLGYSLAAGAPTLAEALAGHGYATGGAVSSVVLSGTSGIGRGFTFWEDSIDVEFAGQPLNRVQRGGDATRQLLERFVQGEQRKPFFAFLHMYEPHSPYDPGEPFQRLAPSLYEGEILKADAVLGRFLDFLKQQGLYEDSVIVVFSDHGEGLGDHGESEHGVFLYREALHVPLIVKLPRSVRAGQTVDGLCGLDQLHDFILEVAGLREEPSSLASVLSGRSPGRHTVYAESYFGRIHFGWAPLRSLRTASAVYIEAPHGEFFDLTTDPGEKKNRLEEKPDLLRQLVAEMAKVPPSFSGPSGSDEEATKRLASLGYLSAPATSGGLPLDPKDRIGELEKMRRALSIWQGGNVKP